MIQCDNAASARSGQRRGKAFGSEDNRAYREAIIDMKKKDVPLPEIAQKLGVTKQSISYAINKIIKLYGKDVFTPETPLYTVEQVAKILGVPREKVRTICVTGEISCRLRSGARRAAYVIEEDGLRQLRLHPEVAQGKICAICGSIFMYLGAKTKVCSEECGKAYSRKKWKDSAQKEPISGSFHGWHKELWQRLQLYTLNELEDWIAITEACKVATLSKEALYWLASRRVVTTRPDPVKKCRGKPVLLFAKSQMKIAREVVAKFQHSEQEKK